MIWEGLRSLEYRGYDSWGIAIFKNKRIGLCKRIGKISRARLPRFALKQARVGLGHTRWATHGRVTKANTHPHLSQSGQVVVVHNGIVENFSSLKTELKSKGYQFQSETDTEIIANLFDYYLNKNSLERAARKVFGRLKGRNAVVCYHRKTETLVGFKSGSPLIFGLKDKKEIFFASDQTALLQDKPQVRHLQDGEMVLARPEEFVFYKMGTNQKLAPRFRRLTGEKERVSKRGYAHFMLKEICEQPRSIMRALAQSEEDLKRVSRAVRKARRVFLTGVGTAGQVCNFVRYFFANFLAREFDFILGSELVHFTSLLKQGDLLIAVSQSGETADTIGAIELAKEKGLKIVSVINVQHSTIDRLADYSLLIRAGVEKAVASTKAATGQIAVLALLAFTLWGRLSEGKRILEKLATESERILSYSYRLKVRKLAALLTTKKDIYIIGRGLNYPIAREAAIKLQEVTYIHAEGFPGGELKHGPLALIEKGTPVVVLVDSETREEILSNAQEVKARGGLLLGIGPGKEEGFDFWLPTANLGLLQGMLNLFPVQLLAYYLAVARGIDPDMPRNLAKAVTVK